jgi:hypothetical protein
LQCVAEAGLGCGRISCLLADHMAFDAVGRGGMLLVDFHII